MNNFKLLRETAPAAATESTSTLPLLKVFVYRTKTTEGDLHSAAEVGKRVGILVCVVVGSVLRWRQHYRFGKFLCIAQKPRMATFTLPLKLAKELVYLCVLL